MKPDEERNYWEKDTDNLESEDKLEMYTPDQDDDSEPKKQGKKRKPIIENEPIHWSAKEFIHGEKNTLWFVIFSIVVLALIALDIFLLRSYTFSLLIVVMTVALIIYSRREPQKVDYVLSGSQGLYIGEKLYHFSDFKSFGLIRDGEHHSIMLIPTKRFASGVSVYFPEEVGEKIVDILGARLPMEPLKLDAIDILIRKLHL